MGSPGEDDINGLLEALGKASSSSPVIGVPEPHSVGWLYKFWRDAWRMDVELQPHAEMAGFIQEALGDCQFTGDTQTLLMLGVPRGTFKTTGVSEATPVAILTKNPNAKGLLDGFRHSVSKARLRAIRRKIENDNVLDDMYGTMKWQPQFREDTWNNEEIIITPRTDNISREASIATAGVDRSMNSQHFDFIIADDLVTDTNVRTPDAREIVYQHILDLLPILNPGGVLILVFTTWHVDDAYMRLIRIDQDRERRGLKAKFRKLIRGCYDGPTGLYFPKRQNHEFLDETRETMGSYKFSSQYLLKPVADEDKTFNSDALQLRQFTFLASHELPSGGLVRVDRTRTQMQVETTIGWDPAGRKPRRTSDSHGITVVGTDVDDTWWILEALGLKASPSVVIDRMCRLIQLYRPWTVYGEDTFGSGLWLDMLSDECEKRGIRTTFTEFQTGGVPKEDRIILLQPRWEKGKIILRADEQGNPVHGALHNQIDKFSAGGIDHEDILDSLVQHLRKTRKPEQRQASAFGRNPVDPEYASWKKQRDEAVGGSESRTGRYGPVWGGS